MPGSGQTTGHDSKNNNNNENGDTFQITQDKHVPDEITYLFAVFALTWGLPGLVRLGKVYEFKGQLFNPGEGRQQYSGISVFTHCWRSLLKIPNPPPV